MYPHIKIDTGFGFQRDFPKDSRSIFASSRFLFATIGMSRRAYASARGAGAKPASPGRYKASLARVHRLLGLPNPAADEQVKITGRRTATPCDRYDTDEHRTPRPYR